MTSPIAPADPPTVPEYPALGDPAFNTKAYTFGSTMAAIVAWISAAVNNAWNNARAAFEAADAASSSAASAADVQAVVLGAANFKGLWDDLSGPLSKPASVKHDGRFWLLLNNLPNVATSEPGVSADWTSLDAGVAPSQIITGNTTVVPGVRYIIGAAGLILDMTGVAWAKGDYFGVREVIGSGTYTINFGSTKDRTQTRGSYVVTAKYRQLDRTYEDATRGLI